MVILEEPIKEVLQLKNYINGEWVKSKSGRSLGVINPATQKTLAKVPMSTRDEVIGFSRISGHTRNGRLA